LSSGGFVLGVTSSPSDQFSGISIIEMESFVYFKIHEDLEEVAIKKSVPNWIFCLHKILQIFLPCLAVFSSGITQFWVLFRSWSVWV
jgi:hypothetical protein